MKRVKLNFSQSQFLEFKVEKILAFVFQELNESFSFVQCVLVQWLFCVENSCCAWKTKSKERNKDRLESTNNRNKLHKKMFWCWIFVNIMYWVKYQKYLSFGSFILIQQYNTSSVCNFTLLILSLRIIVLGFLIHVPHYLVFSPLIMHILMLFIFHLHFYFKCYGGKITCML